MKKIFNVGVALLTSASLVSCSSTTMVRVSDPDAKIFVDDEYRGKGVATHTDTKIVGSATRVRLEKKGCKNQEYMFSRNEEFDAGAIIGGIFLLVPFFWIKKYGPEHQYEFQCEKI